MDKINGFECVCRSNFTGITCEQSAKVCSLTSCGFADDCVDDPVTGLPLCVCRSGYTQGKRAVSWLCVSVALAILRVRGVCFQCVSVALVRDVCFCYVCLLLWLYSG